ncbi:hypothetical protein BDV23DRAFT_186831 [Aspergillus alliaceus]|uniref:Uncharacterized protein n=1 Tax=Petromyces alliaceus TaxID=209559 RepID=A0A5N7BZP5_PETAA|nr:hypothetical protein BDV23DRAFT_186831 [Aspergillus alliaceus]
MFAETSLLIGGSSKQCVWMGNDETGEVIDSRALLQRASDMARYWGRDPGWWVETEDTTLQEAINRKVVKETSHRFSEIVHTLSVKHWSRPTHSGQQERVESPYVISAPSRIRRTLSRPTFGRANGGVAQVESIALNPPEHKDFSWATEVEIRAGKYRFFEIISISF